MSSELLNASSASMQPLPLMVDLIALHMFVLSQKAIQSWMVLPWKVKDEHVAPLNKAAVAFRFSLAAVSCLTKETYASLLLSSLGMEPSPSMIEVQEPAG